MILLQFRKKKETNRDDRSGEVEWRRKRSESTVLILYLRFKKIRSKNIFSSWRKIIFKKIFSKKMFFRNFQKIFPKNPQQIEKSKIWKSKICIFLNFSILIFFEKIKFSNLFFSATKKYFFIRFFKPQVLCEICRIQVSTFSKV